MTRAGWPPTGGALDGDWRTSTGVAVVGDGAVIGDLAVVRSGVVVGEGASIAAEAHVVSEVRPGWAVAGVPAEHRRRIRRVS